MFKTGFLQCCKVFKVIFLCYEIPRKNYHDNIRCLLQGKQPQYRLNVCDKFVCDVFELVQNIPQEKPPTFFIPSSFDRPRSAKNDGGTRKTVVPESFPRNDLRTKIFAFLRFVIVSIVLSSFETWTSQNNQKTSFQARSPTLT